MDSWIWIISILLQDIMIKKCGSVVLKPGNWLSNNISKYNLTLINYAIERVSHHLIIYFPLSIDNTTHQHINSTLTQYYSYVYDYAVPLHGPFYECSVLFDIKNADIKENMLKYADLEVIFHTNNNISYSKLVNETRAKAYLPSIEDHIVDISEDTNCLDQDVDVVETKLDNNNMLKRYDEVVIGGTFDHIHSGHKVLISMAAILAKKMLVVGMSVDELLQNKKHAHVLQSYDERYMILKEFVRLVNPKIICDIEKLRDMYGPSGVRPNLEAIVVSRETEKGGHMVNDKRKENNVQQLDVLVVDLITPSKSAEKLSSTQLRLAREQEYDNQMKYLKKSWDNTCRSLANMSNDIKDKWWKIIYDHYNESQRAYHTLDHINELLCYRDDIKDRIHNITRMDLSIWFHDVIYSTNEQPELNEQKSADMFMDFSKELQLDDTLSKSVYEFIIATKTHQCPNNMRQEDLNDLKLFLDMDLLVLAKNPSKYDLYALQIRQEYSHYDDNKFNSGRAHVLESLVNKQSIYESDTFKHFEQSARLNMTREKLRLDIMNRSNL